MPNGYHHLTYEQRCQINALLQTGASYEEIAAQTGRNKSTISREIARNHGRERYRPDLAAMCARNRRKLASSAPRR
ncbi:MAG: helix-turn-helix domain-containing protein [Chlamydiia bacterium]